MENNVQREINAGVRLPQAGMQVDAAEEKFPAVRYPVSTEYELCLKKSADAKIEEGVIEEGVIHVTLIEEKDGSDWLAYTVIAPNGQPVDGKIALDQLDLQPEQIKPFDIEQFKQLPNIKNKITAVTLKRGHTFPPCTWKVNWQSAGANINLRLLHGLLESEHTSLTRAKEKDLILLLGLSGAGKSTTVNYLKNCEMEPYFTDTGEEHLKPIEGNQTYAKMGCTVESETLAPNIIPLSDFQYFADCPGFEDNRGKEYQICAKVTTQSAIRWSNSVKAAVVLINYASDIEGKAANFRRLVRELRQVFKDLNAVSPSMLFLINKAKAHLKPQHVVNKIKQLKEAAEKKLSNYKSVENPDDKQREELDDTLGQLTFFNLMLSHPDNIMMVNPLDNGTSRDLIMHRLATFAPIDRQQFNLPTHNNDHLEFNKLLGLLFEKGTGLLTQIRDLRKNVSEDVFEYQRLTTQILPEAQGRLSDAKTNKNKSVFQVQLEANYANQKEEMLQIKKLQDEVESINTKVNNLVEEKTLLNSEEPTIHWEEPQRYIPDDRWLMLLLASVTGVAAGAAAIGTIASGGLLTLGGVAAAVGGGATVGGGGGALFSAVKKIVSPIEINYTGVAYPSTEVFLTNDGQQADPPPNVGSRVRSNGKGWFVLGKKDPDAGVYSAKFYADPFSTSGIAVSICLPKKDIPANILRREAIDIEIKSLKQTKSELKGAEIGRSGALDGLQAKAELIQKDVQKEELCLKESGQPAKSSPEEWQELITELQQSVDELNRRIDALKTRLVDLPAQLRVVEHDAKQQWSFMDFLSGVADFTNSPQGAIFNVLFREIHLFRPEAQLPQFFADDAPPPPYELKEDDGRPPLAAPGHASLFDRGPSANQPNVPPQQDGNAPLLVKEEASAMSPV